MKRQDRYLNKLKVYIEDVQRKNILKRAEVIDVPYEDYSDFLALQGHIETHLLNTVGDLQGSSMSYYKFLKSWLVLIEPEIFRITSLNR